MQEYIKKSHELVFVILPPLHHAPHNATLITSNDKMKDLIEIVKSREDSSWLLKGVSETI